VRRVGPYQNTGCRNLGDLPLRDEPLPFFKRKVSLELGKLRCTRQDVSSLYRMFLLWLWETSCLKRKREAPNEPPSTLQLLFRLCVS